MKTRRLALTALATTVAAFAFAGTAQALPECEPPRPALKPITAEAVRPHELTIPSWEPFETPTREWIFYYNSNLKEVAKNEYKPAPLQNGTARSWELTNLKAGTTYSINVNFEFFPVCEEDKNESRNDFTMATTLP